MILVIIQNMMSALTVVCAKTVLWYAQPIFYIGSRLLLAGILLLSYQYIFKRHNFAFNKEHLGLFLQVISIQLYLSYILDSFALGHFTAARVCFFYNLSPFIAAFFSYLVFKEKMTIKKWLGMTIGFVGFLPMLMSYFPSEGADALLLSWTSIMLFGAVACNTYGYIVIRKLVGQKGYSSFMVTGLCTFGAGILALFTSFVLEGWNPLPVTDMRNFAQQLVTVTFVGSILSYGLHVHLLRKYTATFLAFVAFLFPLFGALFGWLFLGETISANFFISAICVFFGLYVFYQEELRQGYIK